MRKVIPIFFLVLFLFPLVQQELHAFGHRDDVACTAKDTKHLHEQHHYCKFCDFSVPVHALLQADLAIVFSLQHYLTISSGSFSFNAFCLNHSGPPRAPPFFSC
jgi:hypothetical protein